MALKAGRYHIEVTRPGYEKHLSWHLLQPGSELLEVELLPETAPDENPPPSRLPSDWAPEMVSIRGGCFKMGSPANEADRSDNERCVDDFQIGRYEVTQAQWRAVMGDNPSKHKGCDDCPVEQVSWNYVQEYIGKLNALTGKRYRLPTEAEWEYACEVELAGNHRCRGDSLMAWGSGSLDENDEKTRPVGSGKRNGFGLYGMGGSVYEWTCSTYDMDYGGAEIKCAGTGDNARRVVRGGSWENSLNNILIPNRSNFEPDDRGYFVGFRLSQD